MSETALVVPDGKAEAKRQYMRDYYRLNQERLKANQRAYYHAHREQARSTSAKWRDANREHLRRQSRQYHRNNRFTYWATSILRKFGVTAEWYVETLAAQGGKCAICNNTEGQIDHRTGKPRRMAVDHNHKTGKVRGILCHRCNLFVGHIEDEPDLIAKAAQYIERHAENIYE